LTFKKLVLPELQITVPEPSAVKEEITPPSETVEPLQPTVEPAEIVKVTPPPDIDSPVVVAAKTGDPPTGWRQLLLSGDPISVTDITKVFADNTNVWSGDTGPGSSFNVQIGPPSSGLTFQADLIHIWNVYGATETVGLRFGPTGALRFIQRLAPNTGMVVNLVKSVWRGSAANTGLYIYTWEAMGGPGNPAYVTYTVLGENVT